MSKQSDLKLFEERQVRSVWDSDHEKWYFSIVDTIAVLTDSPNPQVYWRVLKKRLKDEGNETVTNCHGFKMRAPDGKMRMTDVADTEQLFRLIQSIPSPKAEPFKLWLAQVAAERLDELQDPELSIDRALEQYMKLGYSEAWINQRLKSIEIRKELTDEWKKRGLQEGVQFATLTDIITQAWSDRTTKEYKMLKGLKKENLRDNMTNTELILNMLAEASTKDISAATVPKDFEEIKKVEKQGGNVARVARKELEAKTGKSVVSALNAKSALSMPPKNKSQAQKEIECGLINRFIADHNLRIIPVFSPMKCSGVR
ncbi:MAG: Bro-N domain-containing protein [Flavobacteriales bacterium]